MSEEEAKQSPSKTASSKTKKRSLSDSKLKGNKSPVEVIVAKLGLIGTISTAMLSLIGIGIVAYFSYLQIMAPINATQTAEAKLNAPTSAPNVDCLSRVNTGPATKTFFMQVGPEQVAQVIGDGFWEDGEQPKYGGYFVTINGPYERIISIHNGVYCSPVSKNSEDATATRELLERECDISPVGCSTQIVLP